MFRHVSMQVRNRVRLHALVGLTIWLAPQLVRAWAEGPTCGFPGAFSASAESSEDDEEALLCAPQTPHLLRNPSVESYGAVAGRDAPEDAPSVAARALERARILDESGRYEEALLNLRVVEATMPRIADHVALMRATLHMEHRDYERAAEAYRDAVRKSPSVELRAQARVGSVRSQLRAGAKGAEGELVALLMRYPELPEASSLRIELARHRELTGHRHRAAAIYRQIDLEWPGYPMAVDARERLAVLAAEGVRVSPFAESEQLERAARLVHSGPIEQARATLMALRAQRFSRQYLRQRDALVQSFDELEHRRFAPAEKADDERSSEHTYTLALLKRRLAGESPEKQLEKIRSPHLALYLERAAAVQDRELADVLVRELARRVRSSSTALRFQALTVAVGTASDRELIPLAETLLDDAEYAVPARYHRARALERLGQRDEARGELRAVIARDDSPTRFYASWAEQRLRALDGLTECRAAGRASKCNRAAIDTALQELESRNDLDIDRAILKLTELERTHGGAYPWLGRALDLARLNEVERASDELYEAFLAFRLSGRGTLRAGREAVYRGVSLNRRAVDPLRSERVLLRPLDADARMELAEVASALGDFGLAVNFGGLSFAEQQPLPFAAEVARAARKYRLDPDLLFAVMRVESVYQRRIVSHAGAIGLMQIMPRTGRLIAERLGQLQMTATDLLDPQTNIEFSAWYLSSLIERMDGRLPLAIASYNGGPHNVRAWIRRYGAHVPLDAFLERIPFQETKRYVRRVLGYYASYKARRGERVGLMALRLPSADRPSDVGF